MPKLRGLKRWANPLAVAALAVLAATPARATEGVISTINWYNIEAYCTFLRADEVFDYDDPETWNLVFFIQIGEEDLRQSGYISIEGRLLQLEQVSLVKGTDGRTQEFASLGDEHYRVTLALDETKVWSESTDYRGQLTATGPAGSEVLEIRGSCGG